MSERPDDRDLEEFIAGRSDLSRRYRDAVGREGTPPALDRAVLERAQQAVERGLRARRRTLVVPLALAATVVLSFSVFMVMRDQPGGLPPPAPEAKLQRGDAAATASSDSARSEPQRQLEAAPDAESMRPSFAPAAPPPAAAPGEMDAQSNKAEQAVGAAAGLAAESAPAQPEMRERRAAKARTMLSDQARGSEQAWLERVRQMKARGDLVEARGELENFQRAHPDYEVPDDLRSLLRPVTPPTP